MAAIKAVVENVIKEGKHGPYFVASCLQICGSVTCSLEPTVWQEEEHPEEGEVVHLSKLRQKRAGWRAKAGRYWTPSDEQSEQAAKSSIIQYEQPKICGEVPEIEILRKVFEVVCVTKRHSKLQERKMKAANIVCSTLWHQPIEGKAILIVTGVKMGEEKVPADIKVVFNETLCHFLYFRTGLSGTVHGIGIVAPQDHQYHDVWDLYTTEPTEKGIQRGVAIPPPAPQRWTSFDGKIFGGPEPLCPNCGK